MYRALASQNYLMGMRESDFFSLIGTQHFGKLFSPDGENVACDDYYFLVAFYSFNTGKYTTFTQVMFTLLFCLIPKEIRTTCLVDNLQLFFTLLFQTPTFWWSGFAVQQYLSIIILVLYLFMSILKTFINIAYIAIFFFGLQLFAIREISP